MRSFDSCNELADRMFPHIFYDVLIRNVSLIEFCVYYLLKYNVVNKYGVLCSVLNKVNISVFIRELYKKMFLN